jgi:uncharacterized protein YbjT (DUF2867 family)
MTAIQAQGRKIAITGASGQLGKPTIASLVAQGVHTITAIQRPEATSTFPAGVIVKKGNLEDESFLAEVLKGQDVLVLMPPLSHLVEHQEPAIRAAAKVGVPYVFPSEFGPDPFAGKIADENGLLITKKRVRSLVEKLGVSAWVSVTPGPWLDFCLALGLIGINAKDRKAEIWRGADGKANMATIAHTGEALAAALSLPEADLARHKNKAIYVPSFYLTQREILSAVQRVTGTADADWDVKERNVDGPDGVAKQNEGTMGQGYNVASYTHFMEGHGGDFNHKVDKAVLENLEQLGLHKEELDQAIKAALQ